MGRQSVGIVKRLRAAKYFCYFNKMSSVLGGALISVIITHAGEALHNFYLLPLEQSRGGW